MLIIYLHQKIVTNRNLNKFNQILYIYELKSKLTKISIIIVENSNL